MKEYFYYLRDGRNRPVVTVCLLKLAEYTRKNGKVVTSDSGEVIVRGVAICSHKDDPCMKTGRNIAKGLALKAFVRKESGGLVIRDEAKDVLNDVVPSFWLGADLTERGKYVFKPILSIEERELTKDWVPGTSNEAEI